MGDQPPREKWNERYAQGRFGAGAEAADWLVENRGLLDVAAGGRALDVACGTGRNAVYLARLGYAVDAFDVSDVAIDALRATADAQGLDIDGRVVDLEAQPLPTDAYDLVVNLNYLQRDLFGPLVAALRPGGLLVFETVSRAHVEELGHSFPSQFVLERNELLHAFGALYVRHYREGVLDRAGAPRGVAGLVAQRV